MIAILEAQRAGLLHKEHWLRNIIAGVVVGLVALPLAMAFAMASGVRPEQGIYTSIVAGLCVSLFGGSRVQIAGPTGAFIVVLAGITERFGVDGLMLATLMAGAILVLLGLARLGTVIRYIPDPVIAGFTVGIGTIIFVGQWPYFFGLPPPGGAHFHLKLWHSLLAMPQMDLPTALLGILGLAAVIWGPRVPLMKWIPGPLICVVVVSTVAMFPSFGHVATIGSSFGGIPQGLPHLGLPQFGLERMQILLPAAFTIAMLGAIESLLSAVVADGVARTRHDPNQELIGQGLANLLVPLFGGFAATGAIARTATSLRNGANSPIAGIMHALTLVAILVVMAPLAAHIPLCALAAILFVVAWNMSDVPRVIRMARTAPRADAAILLITFALTVTVDLVVAVNIGVILALLQFLRRMSESVRVLKQDQPQIPGQPAGGESVGCPEGVLVYSIEGPFFFGAVEHLEHALAGTGTDPRALVIRLGNVPFIDATGLRALEDSLHDLERRGVHTALCEANGRVLDKLRRAGLVTSPSSSTRYFGGVAEALRDCITPADSMLIQSH